jgi:hypothetical protein
VPRSIDFSRAQPAARKVPYRRMPRHAAMEFAVNLFRQGKLVRVDARQRALGACPGKASPESTSIPDKDIRRRILTQQVFE